MLKQTEVAISVQQWLHKINLKTMMRISSPGFSKLNLFTKVATSAAFGAVVVMFGL